MASPLRLQVGGLPSASTEESLSTASPARGAEMRDFLQARLQKNRAPPLVHSWIFWHDRDGNGPGLEQPQTDNYENRLIPMTEINDIKQFWSVYNNFEVTHLPLRDSVHLFHKGIKPIWEDPRNEKGGSWTFRVPKVQGPEFWKELCMMAIGEQLQGAVASDRTTFRDDICGVSLGVRFNSLLIQIWNRDGEHTAGIEKLLQVVRDTLSEGLKPKEGSYYYKKHSDHSGYKSGDPGQMKSA